MSSNKTTEETKAVTRTRLSPPRLEPQRTQSTPAVDAFDRYSLDQLVTVYSVSLEDNGAPSNAKTYVRLPPPFTPYVLRISIDAGSAASKGGVLFTNFPLDGSDFVRTHFHQTPLPQNFSKPFEIDLPITKAGSFEYFVEHDSSPSTGGSTSSPLRKRCRPGYFTVEPILSLPARTPILASDLSILPPGVGGAITDESVCLPLDGLVIQSVIAKWMGSFSEWTPHLDLMRDRGYNMIYYTPLQQRGESGSPYSIFDQLAFADDLFDAGTRADAQVATVRRWMERIKAEWGMLGMIDVVLNHTANNSPWLEDHPEAGYNVINSPHLQSALELDTALLEFSASLATLGLPTTLASAADLDLIMSAISTSLLPSLKLYEYYVVDVAKESKAFEAAWSASSPLSSADGIHVDSDVKALSGKALGSAFADACLPRSWSHLGSRFQPSVTVPAAVAFVSTLLDKSPDATSAGEATTTFRALVDLVNLPRYELFNSDLAAILDNTRNRIQYTRLDAHGPRFGPVTPKSPLVESLFTRLSASARTKAQDPRSLALANNGWIWDADPLQDFASADSRTYLRRDLIVWADCVKLRFGTGPDDNPWLWKHMTAYVELLASLFDGFRLDNSHSTPIHVAEVLLDAARRVKPDLYVCAELFTGSQQLDLHFVCRLGLNSLIREAMNANDPQDQSRLLYSYGLGKPIGSMDTDCLTTQGTVTLKGRTRPCTVVPLHGSSPHAFLMDCTHDNESPASKRTAEDALPTGALVTLSRAAIGSNRGFDDLYPRLLDVVTEFRHYETYSDSSANGIGGIKRLLNHLHTEMVLNDCVEGHFHQEGDYITSHRVNPVTHQGYLLVTRTAFSLNSSPTASIAPIRLDGTLVKFVAGASIKILSGEARDTSTTLRGLDAVIEPISSIAAAVHRDASGSFSEIVVPAEFPAGSVLVFATSMDELPDDLDELCARGACEAFAELDMVDLNSLLFRADGEEKDAVGGDGTYDVPGLGALVYCGLQGWMAHLDGIMARNDLGHPLCAHLREGSWALDYVHSRLEKQVDRFPRLHAAASWFKERFDLVKTTVPAFLRPKYFALVINVAYKAARHSVLTQCSPIIRDGPGFVGALALTSVQMYGQVRSASLDPAKETPSLAAGLPHFTAGWARTWGRDVFISLRGLFLVTGQFDPARQHILAFCSVLKHGLIPNLLDSGRTPRYNSRDSPWFMLQNLQDFVRMAPNGIDILRNTVKRRFPLSDEWVAHDDPRAYAEVSTVAEVIQEILQRHARGIHFREYNAGPGLDMQMTDRGFDIDIDVDWETGLVHGGNEWNCGTWMDKMGESSKAGNKGAPGTPRDGAAIEITGLLKSAVRWLAELSEKGLYAFPGVQATIRGVCKTVTWAEWDGLILSSFERLYFVPSDPAQDLNHVVDARWVARRGIYKDVVGTGAGRERADYQLRANFVVAMTVAPELFVPEHALSALAAYETHLVGPLGVRTLDPEDSDYRGYYDNANNSDDRHVAKGWNYHQGPEWVWPIGYFLRAYLFFNTRTGSGSLDRQETYHHIYNILARHRFHIRSDPWAGLPELTNKDGDECYDSCRTQAWSSSTILDVLDDIRMGESQMA